MSGDALAELCRRLGVDDHYIDIWGARRPVSTAAQRSALAAMGVLPDPEADAEVALARLVRDEWREILPPVQVTGAGQCAELPLHLPAGIEALDWRLEFEDGGRHAGQLSPRQLPLDGQISFDGQNHEARRWRLEVPVPPGYHRLVLEGAVAATCTLIAAPARCYQPAGLAGDRCWGLGVQLYSVRSQRNWGIGDLTDLKGLMELAARFGADFVGVNPLHALYPDNPRHCSPYSPSSRHFYNPLYLDVEAIADYAEDLALRREFESDDFRGRLLGLRSAEQIDYPAVAECKLGALRRLFRGFRDRHLGADTARARAFRRFVAERGAALRRHAEYEALRAQHPDCWGWPAWPEQYRDPAGPAVAEFARRNDAEVEFYQYLQWQFTEQLEAALERAATLGLRLGLYQDLAVSVDPGGADTWRDQGLFALEARIGAPPDDFNLHGQDWGLPPFVPGELRRRAYAPFAMLLRDLMRHAGAVRIDHVMSLMRLYWVPPGAKPDEGLYVRYPFSDLLGVLALESHRNHCLVIGEDLGTVPDCVRSALEKTGVLSYRLLYFARHEDHYLAPQEYPRQALVAMGTHDLPPLSGFWSGSDIELRHELGLIADGETRDAQILARARDRQALLLALEREGLLPDGQSVLGEAPFSIELNQALHRFLARAPAQLLVVQAEDLLGEARQVNLPATTDAYPNWSHRLPLNLEHWAASADIAALVDAIAGERGRTPRAAAAPRVRPLPAAERIPDATYRLQLHAGFGFADAAARLDYLDRLGVSDLYLSPILRARPGSPHGYDIVDHASLNPELGGADGYDRLCRALAARGMGQLVDMVPNHMGVMGSDNQWWLDVLENGPASAYAEFFDIDWYPSQPHMHGRVLLPVLGQPYGRCLEAGEIRLCFDAEAGAFYCQYFDHRLPIDPRTYPLILAAGGEALDADGDLRAGFESLITALRNLPGRDPGDAQRLAERRRDQRLHQQRLAELYRDQPLLRAHLGMLLERCNGDPGQPTSFDALHDLLESQAYRLADWRVAADDINYRRFFDINDLAALRMERPAVFDATHAYLLELLASGRIQGLRIDHPDGLYDPESYFTRLQDCFRADDSSRPLYLVAEKILAPDETLPDSWPVQGTTGYEFSAQALGTLVDPDGEAPLDALYRDIAGALADFEAVLRAAKDLILEHALGSELRVLADRLARIARADRRSRDFTFDSLRGALARTLAQYPIYRTYLRPGEDNAAFRPAVEEAAGRARDGDREREPELYAFLAANLLADSASGASPELSEAIWDFALAAQQLSAPVMAKGLEDTAGYRYLRLLCHNEVGAEPARFAVDPAAFQAANRRRRECRPHGLLASSTHDSKRSEDVRCRLAVLSEVPRLWAGQVRAWLVEHPASAPDANDRYLLYQTLFGSWPLEPAAEVDWPAYRARIQDYLRKALREAKRHTNWRRPDTGYEAAMADLVGARLAPEAVAFRAEMQGLQDRLLGFGLLNSLALNALKLSCPGVPDIYQGCELWDFSLVDPDNRRAVDYRRRERLLAELEALDAAPAALSDAVRALFDDLSDGRAKLYLIWRLLRLRRRLPALLRDGDYQPLAVRGARARHLIAYRRRLGDRELVMLVPRLPAGLCAGRPGPPLGAEVWHDTHIELGGPAKGYRDLLSGLTVGADGALAVGAVLTHFPVAALCAD